ncbi:MAG: hypothetical protein HYU36_02865 [Planctomycetes bacterium]|nr:hypothetical protein [Planctomycetota bacterium]
MPPEEVEEAPEIDAPDGLDMQVDLALRKGDPTILFYASFDEDESGVNPQAVIRPFQCRHSAPAPGVVGGSRVLQGIQFERRFTLHPARGAIHLWFRQPDTGWNPGRGLPSIFTFLTTDPKKEIALSWGGIQLGSSASAGIAASREWHQVVHAWDAERKISQLYLDGETAGSIPPPEGMAYNQLPESRIGNLGLCLNLTCQIDELYIWDRAVGEEAISAAFQRVKLGKPAWPPSLHPHPPRSLSEANDLSLLKSAGRPPLPDAVDWKSETGPQERSTTRLRMGLNGYWRYQPVSGPLSPPRPDRWLYARVPGSWNNSPLFELLDTNGRPVPKIPSTDGQSFTRQWGGESLSDLPSSYIERDIFVPADWADSLVLLQFQGLDVVHRHLVYVNHQFAAESSDDTTLTLDISRFLQPGQVNRILLYNHFNHVLFRDVWLDVRREKNLVLEDVFFMPSVREKRLGLRLWLWNLSAERRSLEVGLTVFPDGQARQTRFLGRQALTLEPGEKGIRDVSLPWPDPRCWHPDDPFLYRGVVSLEVGGQRIDESYPERFGFREFWIRDGTFMLNEHPFLVRMFSNDSLWKSECGDPEWYRLAASHFAGCKALHINTQRLWARPMRDAPYALADEAGQLMAPFNGQPTRATAGLRDRARREVAFPFLESYVQGKYRARSFLHELKNHPSICFLFYDSGSADCWIPGSNYAANLTESFFQECLERRPWIAEWAAFVQHVTDWFHEVDPTRPAFSYTSGLLGPARSCLSYYNFSQPMQEWQEQWTPAAQENRRPLFNTEFCIVYPHALYSQSVVENVKREPGFDTIVAEQCATYFGDRAYLQEQEAYHRGLNRIWKGRRSFEAGGEMGFEEGSAGYWELKRFFARHLEQAYRYLRVNQGFHVEIDRAFRVEGEKSGWRRFTLRSPGLVPDASFPTEGVLIPPEPRKVSFQHHGAAWSPHTSPAYAFIGGPSRGHKADFSLKDHAFLSGETVEKAVYALNDHPQPLGATLRWTLARRGDGQAGEPAASGSLPISVPPGERQEYNFSFPAPIVTGKTRFLLRIEPQQSSHPLPPDEFPIEVFPPDPPPKLPDLAIGLLDSAGDTARWLDRAGVRYRRLGPGDSLEGIALLLIGRKFVDAEGRKTLRALELQAHLVRGLRCLIFEQAMTPVGSSGKERDFALFLPDQPDRRESAILGFRGEDRRSRFVFVRAPEHPILQGLEDEDFANWRGSTDIEEAHPKPPPEIQDSHKGLKRFPRWSNKGIVAFYQVEKPQAGCFRCLLDCEYDLCLTPLLEFRVGRGLVLLNLLDVTNRYGIDPVATRLAHRMLSYMASTSLGPRERPAAFFGHPSHREVLDGLRLRCRTLESLDDLAQESLLIVGPGKLEKATAGPPVQEQPKPGEGVPEPGGEGRPGASESEESDEEFEEALAEKARLRARPEALPALKSLAGARKSIQAFLEHGGNLFVLPLANETEAKWLPIRISFIQKEFGIASVPTNAHWLSGLGVSDFFWRGWRTRLLPATPDVPATQATDPALLIRIPFGKGNIFLLAFEPCEIPDARATAKMYRAYSALLFYLEAPTTADPDVTVTGYNPGKFPYLLRTISFDPYDHGYY